MDGQTQKFVQFLQGISDYNKVFTDKTILAWANGTQGSAVLNKLYADFQAGNLDNVTNWIRGEAGDNLQNPLWVNYKQPGLTPEMIFLQGAIANLQNQKEQYMAAGGEDKVLLQNIDKTIASMESSLEDYQEQQAADLKKVATN